jgi:predicted O-methyltransferase YrrM
VDLHRFAAVDAYLDDLFGPADPILAAALARADAAGLPAIQVGSGLGRLLQTLALLVGARRILEVGALGGYSAIWLARALPADGRLISLEYEPRHAEVARVNLAAAGLADRSEVRVGRGLDLMQELIATAAPPCDMIFIDADKPAYPEYLDAALQLTRPGGLIVADNVIRDGGVLDSASTDASVQGVRAFNARFAAEPRLRAAFLPLIGAKGYDGVAIGVVQP